MTAAERRAVSARMKAYWAARREGNASPPSSLTSASGATPKSAVKSTAGRGRRKKHWFLGTGRDPFGWCGSKGV